MIYLNVVSTDRKATVNTVLEEPKESGMTMPEYPQNEIAAINNSGLTPVEKLARIEAVNASYKSALNAFKAQGGQTSAAAVVQTCLEYLGNNGWSIDVDHPAKPVIYSQNLTAVKRFGGSGWDVSGTAVFGQ